VIGALVAASLFLAQTRDSVTAVPAARLVAENVRTDPAASAAGLEHVPVTIRSPDQRRVARVRTLTTTAEGQRSRITITGPGQRTVTFPTVVNYYGLAWSLDSSKVAYAEGAVVTVADSDGKTRQVVYTGPGARYPGACIDLQWSDGGRTLSFTQVENARQLDLSTPTRVTITLGVRPDVP
jgi:hypothetical protein